MTSLGDALLGKIPVNITNVAGKKKGRGRPRKVVQVEGIYIHKKADNKSDRKPLSPKTRYDIRHRYSELNIKFPKAGIVRCVDTISKEFKLTYAQVYELVV